VVECVAHSESCCCRCCSEPSLKIYNRVLEFSVSTLSVLITSLSSSLSFERVVVVLVFLVWLFCWLFFAPYFHDGQGTIERHNQSCLALERKLRPLGFDENSRNSLLRPSSDFEVLVNRCLIVTKDTCVVFVFLLGKFSLDTLSNEIIQMWKGM